MNALENKTAFITGSTLGIGREMAVAASAAGANVVLHGLHDDDAAKDALTACPGEAALVTGDLASDLPGCALDVAEKTIELFPDVDLLVCNAGTYIDKPFLEMDFATFDRTMKLNVYSQFVLVQHFARRWIQNGVAGRIVITGSINGRLAEDAHVAYDTSKGAIESMVRSLAVSLAPHGIRVNGIAPGLFRTPLTEPGLKDPNARAWMELHTPNGKVPGPEVVGGTTVFLLSDAAEHIHGQMLFVDGGMSAWQQPEMPAGWNAGMANKK
ncbi:SDR family NAD(P)-dependent oxidoreductase [Fuerstiella marisgermanici]|uniref:Glucose 1-dehydrogenase n=1 Tax=Fuerstiella marisgermanici TaxID=1891926 RepID=A0A1P8WID8_9PLAN|nr:SDR family oxidoreductase [Fuerstiella marisgermanici]APZ93822.1 Glucose 1-dehydrogenase [Fuerstiella marisgermanici]